MTLYEERTQEMRELMDKTNEALEPKKGLFSFFKRKPKTITSSVYELTYGADYPEEEIRERQIFLHAYNEGRKDGDVNAAYRLWRRMRED
jgi:hypothetical protein